MGFHGEFIPEMDPFWWKKNTYIDIQKVSNFFNNPNVGKYSSTMDPSWDMIVQMIYISWLNYIW